MRRHHASRNKPVVRWSRRSSSPSPSTHTHARLPSASRQPLSSASSSDGAFAVSGLGVVVGTSSNIEGLHNNRPLNKKKIKAPQLARRTSRRLIELTVHPGTAAGAFPFALGGRNGDIVEKVVGVQGCGVQRGRLRLGVVEKLDSSSSSSSDAAAHTDSGAPLFEILSGPPGTTHWGRAAGGAIGEGNRAHHGPSLPRPTTGIIGCRVVSINGLPTRGRADIQHALAVVGKLDASYTVALCPAVASNAPLGRTPSACTKVRVQREVNDSRKLLRPQASADEAQAKAAKAAAEKKKAAAAAESARQKKQKMLKKKRKKQLQQRKLQREEEAAEVKCKAEAREQQRLRELDIILAQRKQELQRIQAAADAAQKQRDQKEAEAAATAAREAAKLEAARLAEEQRQIQAAAAAAAAAAAEVAAAAAAAEAAEARRREEQKRKDDTEKRRRLEEEEKEAKCELLKSIPPAGKPPTTKINTTGALRELPPKAQTANPQACLLQAMTLGFIDAPDEPGSAAVPVAKSGPCDKCDGDHHENDCPYFKKARSKHADAWANYRKKATTTADAPPFILRGATVVRQPGDGSCLFHSLSFGLQKCADGGAMGLRRALADFVEQNPELLISGTPLKDWVLWDSGLNPKKYAKRMRASAHWGGAIEIACCAAMYGCNVHVFEASHNGASFRRISMFDCPESMQATAAPIHTVHVLYGGRVHYDALRTP